MNQVAGSKDLFLSYPLVTVMELFKEYSLIFISSAQNGAYFMCLSATVIRATTADIYSALMCQACSQLSHAFPYVILR